MDMVRKSRPIAAWGSGAHGLIAGRTGWLAAAAALVCALALFARVMAYPLEHDEQIYVPAGVLFSWRGLYDELAFSHFPNLPLLLSSAFALFQTDHYILTGRALGFAAWIGTGVALLLLGRRYCGGGWMTALMIALIAFNPAFLEETGMAVTNNFVPIPFALFGVYCFIRAADRIDLSPGWAAASGALLALAAGFKANYLVLVPPFAAAALLAPATIPFARRVARLALPMLVGGVVGGAPSLFFALVDPQCFVAHTYSFHQGPQLGFWAAHADPLDPKAIGLRDKYLLASEVWFASARIALALSIAFVIMLAAARARVMAWPVATLAAATLVAAIAAFVPTPAFPQYYTLPLPFAIVLAGLLHGRLSEAARAAARPFVIAALAVTALTGAPMLFKDLPALARPSEWAGLSVHREAERMASVIRAAGPIATLAPVHALEAGRPIYPQLALGPFVYRAADWIPPGDRRHYRNLAAPGIVPELLRRSPPAAVLVGLEGALDRPFEDFARAAGYETRVLMLGGRPATLFVRAPRAPPGP